MPDDIKVHYCLGSIRVFVIAWLMHLFFQEEFNGSIGSKVA